MNDCAVFGCTQEGKAQRCPYDGAFHGHGRIHYTTEGPFRSALKFRHVSGEWYLMCDTHYRIVCEEVEAAKEVHELERMAAL